MRHTYNFGVIGNCAYLGYVDLQTNISWMCWPRFDSSFIFGQLLDTNKGGEFSIKPAEGDFQSSQYYVENTNVLCTEVVCSGGKYRITDFAPRFLNHDRYFRPIMLIRKVEPLEGVPIIKVKCDPRGDYGSIKPEMQHGSNHLSFHGYKQPMRLTTNVSLTSIETEQAFVLNETKYLVLTYGQPLEAPLEYTVEEFLLKTIRYWRRWVKSTSIYSFHQARVIRSALILKIHQYEDTGAIIAAGTTSLPEAPGSTRNWDYRFCWMRDSYYTLTAFNNIGHFEESERYFLYITNIISQTTGRYQPLYAISGEDKLVERELDLEGYLGNKPVRVGNDAYTHIQNDVYGQVLMSLLPLFSDKRLIGVDRSNSLNLVKDTLDKIAQTLDEADAGLWEFRNLKQHHCYTNLFQWAGCKAAAKIATIYGDHALLEKATRLEALAQKKVDDCYDLERGVYTQAVGTKHLDASCLQLIMMNFVDPSSERAAKHLREMEKDLKTAEGLFYRYKHSDDFGTPETTFLICAFWYVEALACVGRVDEAVEQFEKLASYANHLGLLSEDVDAKTGSQWGNFPQAYSHVGLVNAAYRIAKKLDQPSFL